MLTKFHTIIALGMGAMILAPDVFASDIATATTRVAVKSTLSIYMTADKGTILVLPIKAGTTIGTFTVVAVDADADQSKPDTLPPTTKFLIEPDGGICAGQSSNTYFTLDGATPGDKDSSIEVKYNTNLWKNNSGYVDMPSPNSCSFFNNSTLNGNSGYPIYYSAVQNYTSLKSGRYSLRITAKLIEP
ncbi:hypothetical protein RJV04_005067 [Salmonella enterica]|nr:hypothetical protein [Salmonella enterica]